MRLPNVHRCLQRRRSAAVWAKRCCKLFKSFQMRSNNKRRIWRVCQITGHMITAPRFLCFVAFALCCCWAHSLSFCSNFRLSHWSRLLPAPTSQLLNFCCLFVLPSLHRPDKGSDNHLLRSLFYILEPSEFFSEHQQLQQLSGHTVSHLIFPRRCFLCFCYVFFNVFIMLFICFCYARWPSSAQCLLQCFAMFRHAFPCFFSAFLCFCRVFSIFCRFVGFGQVLHCFSLFFCVCCACSCFDCVVMCFATCFVVFFMLSHVFAVFFPWFWYVFLSFCSARLPSSGQKTVWQWSCNVQCHIRQQLDHATKP